MNLETVIACIFGIATIVAVVLGYIIDNELLLLTGAVAAACIITIGVNSLTIKRELKDEVKKIKDEIEDLRKSLKAD
jgi:hypothetical protein